MTRLSFLVLLVIGMISCDNDEREAFTAEDIEAEIIDMNWYSTVKDLYVPDGVELKTSLRKPASNQ